MAPRAGASDGPTAQLARFAVEWKRDDAASVAAHHAVRAVVDVVGAAVAGSTERASALAETLARDEGAAGPAVVIGHDWRASATWAAWVNGVTAHAIEFDDVGLHPGVGHPSVSVVPAALATAEHVGAEGRELLDAVIVGFEVAARLGASGGGSHGAAATRGFHGTSVFGGFGAAAASSRLLGLDAARTALAFGIVGSQAGGLRANFGTMTKPLHAGEVNRGGVLAALLAREGFTAHDAIVEARHGWAQAFAPDAPEDARVVQGLGEQLAIAEGLKIKDFPSCGAAHAPTRTVLAAFAEHAVDPEEVAEVELEMSETVAHDTLMYWWPADPTQARFSLAFNVAAAWADGRVGLDSFTHEKIAALESYRDRIRVRGRDGRPPVVVRLHTVDGRELTTHEPTAARSPWDDATGEDPVRVKFRAGVCPRWGRERADVLLERLDALDALDQLRDLTELLR